MNVVQPDQHCRIVAVMISCVKRFWIGFHQHVPLVEPNPDHEVGPVLMQASQELLTDPEGCRAVGCPFRHAWLCKREAAHVGHPKGPLGAGRFLRGRFGHGRALSLTAIERAPFAAQRPATRTMAFRRSMHAQCDQPLPEVGECRVEPLGLLETLKH
jgi:hypothetical protein